MYPLAICRSFLENNHLLPLPIFKVNGFLLSSYMNLTYVLDTNLLLDRICKYFLPFHRCPFHLVDSLLCYIEVFSLT